MKYREGETCWLEYDSYRGNGEFNGPVMVKVARAERRVYGPPDCMASQGCALEIGHGNEPSYDLTIIDPRFQRQGYATHWAWEHELKTERRNPCPMT